MARTSEPSESANSVPAPELNPLQNPLLAENMNRWAEVYFTNPPDRRDAAVVELLQELVQEKQRREEQQRRPVMAPFARSRDLSTALPDEREEVVYCRACRTENPASHQFCGNCGQKLEREDPRARESQLDSSQQRHAQAESANAAPERSVGEFHEEVAADDGQEYAEEASAEEQDSSSYTPAFANSDLSLFQSLRVPDDAEEEDWEYGPQRSSSYRYYVAAVLAILIVGLGYLAWRGAQSSRAGNEASAPPPAPAAETAQPAAPASTEKSAATQPAPVQAASESAQPAESPASDGRDEPQKSDKVVRASETHPLAAKAEPVRAAAVGNGAEELAMAQSYLSGTDGRARDGGEAAKWLWKSISKHNGQATLMLADLYLRGDGVPKNCEQGRVLLDSAAERGITGAGERLRNLQAFGCH
ncbi:MAG TPA: hypothetical protein VMP68_04795 [Candidatus Eisenbacteria bacterium]|nr:hypothetical protein [Candidatus Eisenbacteria bacterium]